MHAKGFALLCVQAFNVSVKASQSSSFIGGLGRLLDKGINRLISGDLPPSGPPSTGSEADPFARQLSKASDPGSPQVSTWTFPLAGRACVWLAMSA